MDEKPKAISEIIKNAVPNLITNCSAAFKIEDEIIVCRFRMRLQKIKNLKLQILLTPEQLAL